MPESNDIYQLSYAILEKAKNDSLSWQIKDFLNNTNNQIIYFLNAHGVNNAINDRHFAKLLMNGDYLLRDGIGVHMAFKLLKFDNTDNLNGTDLIPKIISQYKERKIAVFGASDQTLNDLRTRLTAEGYNNLVSLQHGFYDEQHYINICKTETPDIVVLCMGMPRQEILSEKLSPYTKLTICGGGWADFYSGTKSRAPLWVQKANIEWLYRLANEPFRLGKRYTIDVLRYFYNIFQVWRSRP